jgi:N utilization substance protein B
MGARRKAREAALQMLYQSEVGGQPPHEVVSSYWQGQAQPLAPEAKRFAELLFLGAVQLRPRLDAALAGVSEHWKVPRMAAVDRNVLRLALYEMLFVTDTPRVVVIDEAIEIARRFGSEESGQFVNGVLDELRRRIEKIAAVDAEPRAALDALGRAAARPEEIG